MIRAKRILYLLAAALAASGVPAEAKRPAGMPTRAQIAACLLFEDVDLRAIYAAQADPGAPAPQPEWRTRMDGEHARTRGPYAGIGAPADAKIVLRIWAGPGETPGDSDLHIEPGVARRGRCVAIPSRRSCGDPRAAGQAAPSPRRGWPVSALHSVDPGRPGAPRPRQGPGRARAGPGLWDRVDAHRSLLPDPAGFDAVRGAGEEGQAAAAALLGRDRRDSRDRMGGRAATRRDRAVRRLLCERDHRRGPVCAAVRRGCGDQGVLRPAARLDGAGTGRPARARLLQFWAGFRDQQARPPRGQA